MNHQRPLKVLTWHIHGSYLYYLLQTPHEFYVPVRADRCEAYGGLPKNSSFDWPANAHEIPAQDVAALDLDVILFQAKRNYLHDQFEILTEDQRTLPRVYLEHDPPREHPTDTHHWVDDPNALLIHVTQFNRLMWDSNRTPTRVIEHGVTIPQDVTYTGELDRGIVVVNGLASRGRRLGADVFEYVRSQVPLDLVGMQSQEAGGLGEVSHRELAQFEVRYRFFFNPIRYTSLGLAVCEAMMAGLPVIGLATTEMAAVIENGISGFVDTDPDKLIDAMKSLIADRGLARRLGDGARKAALKRFNIQRFAQDWDTALRMAASKGRSQPVLELPSSTSDSSISIGMVPSQPVFTTQAAVPVDADGSNLTYEDKQKLGNRTEE